MKQTITEIFIEVEETIYVKSAPRKNPSDEEIKEDVKPAIEICPHCGKAIFGAKNIELKGDLEI